MERDEATTPASPANSPESAKTVTVMRAVGTPARCAASGLPPVAYTYRPNRVADNAIHATATVAREIQLADVRPPNRLRAISRKASPTGRMMLRSLTTKPMPDTTKDVARVVMNELILAYATTEPFNSPTARPKPHPASTPRGIDPVAFSTRSATSGAATATAEMDMSKPPAIIVSVETEAEISSAAC